MSGCYKKNRENYAGNRPFPSFKKSHFPSEAKCEAIDMKMSLNYDANKTYFHNKGFALSLVLKVRFFGTRKWPIAFEQKEKETQIKNEQTNKNKKEKNNSEFLALIGLRTTQGPG